MKTLGLVCILMLAVSGSAHAKEWVVDYDHSKLTFIGDQNGEKFNGGFKKFQTWINFDPAAPESGSISAVVDISSAYAGTSERDDMLPQKDWFDTSNFPSARFVSSALKKTGPTSYIAVGTLTIKGISHALSLPFDLIQEGDHWHAHGQVTLMRNLFNVGIDMFANESIVKNNVDLGIDIIAK